VKALSVREDYFEDRIDLLAPGLIRYEIGNALRFHPGSGPKELADAVKTIGDMQIDQAELDPETVATASDIAFQERITFFDAVYIALAERNTARLITDDQLLYKRASGKRNLLYLLKSYKSPRPRHDS
jgi:predicted nucleic acid-binding protein